MKTKPKVETKVKTTSELLDELRKRLAFCSCYYCEQDRLLVENIELRLTELEAITQAVKDFVDNNEYYSSVNYNQLKSLVNGEITD